MPMPFSPCEPNVACPDVTITILTKVFGPIITLLINGQDPNTPPGTMHLLASTIGFFNSGLLVVASLIVTYVAIMGAINTANDGEAMGRSWSAFATPLRIVAGGAVLLPSASGYSFIQMIVFMISLWGVGFANGIYKLGITVGLMNPQQVVSSSYKPGNFYGMRQFAKDYIAVAYCSRTANSLYADPMGTPQVRTGKVPGTGPDKLTVQGTKKDEVFHYADRNPVTNLAGGDPICGTVNFTTYSASGAFPGDTSGTHVALDVMRAKMMQVKVASTIGMMTDINKWIDEDFPNVGSTKTWDSVKAAKFNAIVQARENQVGVAMTTAMTTSEGKVEEGTQKFIDGLTLEGWSMAGGSPPNRWPRRPTRRCPACPTMPVPSNCAPASRR